MKIQVTVLIFSGRPNPTWELEGNAADKIINHWQSLPSTDKVELHSPQLGYQGCRIDLNPYEHFVLFNGYGFSFKNGKQIEQRGDPGRKIEKMIINNAPAHYRDIIGQTISF